MGEIYKIVKGDGAGGLLNPPGDPSHTYSIESYSSSRKNASMTGSYSIDSTDEWIPEDVREQARQILDKVDRAASELWIRNVYGYFRNMWTTDGKPWTNVRDLASGRPEGAPDEWHAAAVYVRKWFPDHEPRTDLIDNPGKGYGSYPCVKCGQRVQYEARFDALAIVSTSMRPGGGTDWSYVTDCPEGGAHEV